MNQPNPASQGETSPYQIRLVGPWHVIPPGESQCVSIQIPCHWTEAFGELAGVAHFTRKFNRPTHLTPSTTIKIRLPVECGTIRKVSLNQIELKEIEPYVFLVNHLELTMNELNVELEFDPVADAHLQGGLYAPVFLEIWEQEA